MEDNRFTAGDMHSCLFEGDPQLVGAESGRNCYHNDDNT